MAVDRVYIWRNSSIMQDEVLSHRIGLIPFGVDHRWFEEINESVPNDANTLVFRLDVTCRQENGVLKHEKGVIFQLHFFLLF